MEQDCIKKEGGSPRTVLVQAPTSTNTPTHNNNTTTSNNNNKAPLQSQITIINNSVVNATTSNQSETSSTSSLVQNNPSINTAAGTTTTTISSPAPASSTTVPASGTITLDNRSHLIIKKIPQSDEKLGSEENCSESDKAPTTPATTPAATVTSVNDSIGGYRGAQSSVIIPNLSRLNPNQISHFSSIPSPYFSAESGTLLASNSMPPYSWPYDLSTTKTDISDKGELIPGMVVGTGDSTSAHTRFALDAMRLYNVDGAIISQTQNVNDIIENTLEDYEQDEQQHAANGEEANYLTLSSANGEGESRSPMHEDMNFANLTTVQQITPMGIEGDYEHDNR